MPPYPNQNSAPYPQSGPYPNAMPSYPPHTQSSYPQPSPYPPSGPYASVASPPFGGGYPPSQGAYPSSTQYQPGYPTQSQYPGNPSSYPSQPSMAFGCGDGYPSSTPYPKQSPGYPPQSASYPSPMPQYASPPPSSTMNTPSPSSHNSGYPYGAGGHQNVHGGYPSHGGVQQQSSARPSVTKSKVCILTHIVKEKMSTWTFFRFCVRAFCLSASHLKNKKV